jgi:hypothetical protein
VIRRSILPALLLGLAVASAAAAAPTRLGDGRLAAFASSQGRPYSVLDDNSVKGPVRLLRGTSLLGSFADADAEFPDVAVSRGRATVAWGETISGGQAIFAATADRLDQPLDLGFATGPGRLSADAGGAVVAFPDRDGDVALVEAGPPPPSRGAYEAVPPGSRLTANAPELRHLPLDSAAGPRGTLVLDLVQTRKSTELSVIGPGAPSQPLLRISARRDLEGSMAVDARGGISVAYVSSGRVVLATSRGNRWTRRRLKGSVRTIGAPSVARARGKVVVAYEQRDDVRVDVNGRERPLTGGPGTDSSPLATVDPETGAAWVGWSHRDGRGRATALLSRVR